MRRRLSSAAPWLRAPATVCYLRHILRAGLAGAVLFLAALLPSTARAQAVGQVFQRANPSVVTIRTTEREIAGTEPGQFTGVAGLGSGVLISADGKIMTAAHVVQLADKITVEFLSGETVGAQVVASEPDADVALLRLASVPAGAVPARLGDSDRARIGDQVLIIGAPYGIGHSLSVGYVSARHKPNTIFGAMAAAEFLQTDAAINQGNSGGPMFNMQAEVIGVVSHIISKSGGFEGLGSVVSSNMARKLLLEQRSFWSGTAGFVLSSELAKVFNLPQPVGLLVQRIAKNPPAEGIGLRPGTMQATIGGQTLTVGGDIILEVEGIRIENQESYTRIQERLSRKRAGETIALKVLREGRIIELSGVKP